MKEKKNNDERIELNVPINRRAFKYAALFVVFVAFVFLVMLFPQKIGESISTVLKVLTPFFIGFCLAYVANLLMRPLEKFWLWCFKKQKNPKVILKLKRPICLAVSFLIILGALFAIVFMIIPAFKETIFDFAEQIPQHAKTVEKWYHNLSDYLLQHNFELPEQISFNADKITDFATSFIANYGNNVINTTVNITASIVGAIIDIFLGIVFAVYLLAQKEKLGEQSKKAVRAVFKPKNAEKILDITTLANGVFTKFVTGQLTEACIIGVLCFIGMIIFDMPYAGMISVLIGFTALIPIFGAFIGTGIGAFLILLKSPVMAFWFIVFVLVLQQLEGNLIYPRVVGKSVGLPGIWVLSAVTIGGGFFGVLGMLFSVPICSILYVMFRKYVNNKLKDLDAEEPKIEAE